MPIYTGPIDNVLGGRETTFHTKGAPDPGPPWGPIDGRRYYTLYDENTGHTRIKEATYGGSITDRYIGYYDENGKFHRNNNSVPGQDEIDFFSSPEGTKQALKASQLSAKKDLMTNGSTATNNKPVSEAEATKLTKDITNTNNATDPATNPEDSDKDADDKTGEGDTKDIADKGGDKTGTRKEFGKI